MWPTRYEDRLAVWNALRENNRSNELEVALAAINDWWQSAPMINHYLHWDDLPNWPDPWELLVDNRFCSVARALGIVYTLHMINRPDVTEILLSENDTGDNLVLINKGKYILNWAPRQLLNITSPHVKIQRSLDVQLITKKID